MYDYDKLFAEGNIIGVLYGIDSPNKTMPYTYEEFQHMCSKDGRLFRNESLSAYNVKIQYIIRLDENGNVVEKLFDRERDVPKPMPKLETGMFVRVNEYGGSHIGFVDAENNHVIYQEGGYDFIYNDDINGCGIVSKIVEVYGKDACAFDFCDEDVLIWRKPESN